MTNREKFKEVFGKDIKWSDLIEPQRLALKSAQINGIDCMEEWLNAEYKEPSNSEKPNKSVEEKCPCYDCEHFEIKGWSHCKIHEYAYGNLRCTDYHKVDQGSDNSEKPISSTTKNGISNKSIIYKAKESKEIQEDLDKLSKLNKAATKSETPVSLDVYNQVAKERDMAIQQLHDLGYELGITIPDIKYHSHHCVDRRLVEALVHRYLKETTDDHVAFYEELLDLPLVTPIRPKGRWVIDDTGITALEYIEGYRQIHCTYCGHKIKGKNIEGTDFCPKCGAEMRASEEWVNFADDLIPIIDKAESEK